MHFSGDSVISNTAKQFIEKEREYFAPMNARDPFHSQKNGLLGEERLFDNGKKEFPGSL